MAIYINIDSVQGDATQDNHTNWLYVHSLQWGAGRGVSSPVGGSKNREASEPSISEVTFTKDMDKSSAKLFQLATSDNKGKAVTIDLVRTSQGGPMVYMQYKLEDALVSGYSMSSGGDTPSESISLNFTKIEMTYTPMEESGDEAGPQRASYDLAKAVST